MVSQISNWLELEIMQFEIFCLHLLHRLFVGVLMKNQGLEKCTLIEVLRESWHDGALAANKRNVFLDADLFQILSNTFTINIDLVSD